MKRMNAYRQAAIVVASLDRRAADDLLERLPEAQARAIRDELVLLEDLQHDERDEAIDQYLGSPSMSEASPVVVEFGSQVSDSERVVAEVPAESASSCLTELLAQEDGEIVMALRHERAAIVAALLRRLPKKRSANVLRGLPSSLQCRVLTNLNHGRIASSAIVDVIADAICDKYAAYRDTGQDGSQADGLQEIFHELSRDEQREMLRSLAEENPMLAQRLVPSRSDDSHDDCYC